MTKTRPKLENHHFYSQFHNLDKHHDTDGEIRPKWYHLHKGVPSPGRPYDFKSIHKDKAS